MQANGYNILPYMRHFSKQGEQNHETESYVSSPPALMILEASGDVFTLGLKQILGPRGEYAFDVLRNGVFVGVFASRIERNAGKVRAFTTEGWKVWTGRGFF